MAESEIGIQKPAFSDVTNVVNGARRELFDIALDIHAHPETNYQEHHAAAVLSEALEKHGFSVERGFGGLETAFRATLEGGAGKGSTVAILAEYDALPDLGHGCGHNLIAMTAVGAALGIQAALPSLPGRLVILGTPAEEGGGGKIKLLEAGAFREIDSVLMSHPGGHHTVIRTEIPMDESSNMAMVGFRYCFYGKAAHATSAPHEGINALNSVIQLFVRVDAMRQHLREDVRIHGIITDGGKAPNVIPDFAATNFMLRSRDHVYLRNEVVKRVNDVAEAAAEMVGSRLEIQPLYPFYESTRPNTTLAKAALANARAVGLNVDQAGPGGQGSAVSTDAGNVSQRCPTFTLSFAVSPKPIAIHSKALAEAAKSEFALASALNVGKILALTACDLLAEPALVSAAWKEFEERGCRLARKSAT